PDRKAALLRAVFAAGRGLGGMILGGHGIGTEKKPYFMGLEKPAKLALLPRIKQAVDPAGILNPGTIVSLAGGASDVRGTSDDPHVGRLWRRRMLHESRHVRDAFRRGARQRARNAWRPRAVRGRGQRCRRRLRADGRQTGVGAPAPGPRTR